MAKVDAKLALAQPPHKGTAHYTKKDVILYALGLGCQGENEHRYVYELHPEFNALPTMPVVWNASPHDIKSFGKAPKPNKSDKAQKKEGAVEWGMFGPGIPKFNFAMLLHGEQYVELAKPGGLPTSGKFNAESRTIGVHDKGKGLLYERETKYLDPSTGEEVCKMVSGSFVRKLTGFESAGTTYSNIMKRPSRDPDAVVEIATSPFQAELYRVNGDYNPLHIDHKVATSVGFEKPILHGLCSYGIACRAVLRAFTGGDTKQFKAIKVRFASPVYPGETLVTEMWKDNEKHDGFERILFETKIKSRGVAVLSSAYVDLFTTKANL